MGELTELARLVNEYSAVRISLDTVPASPRLVLHSDRTGDTISLDATALEAIASLDHQAIGKLVATFSDEDIRE